jgi:hypothetical protein
MMRIDIGKNSFDVIGLDRRRAAVESDAAKRQNISLGQPIQGRRCQTAQKGGQRTSGRSPARAPLIGSVTLNAATGLLKPFLITYLPQPIPVWYKS